MDSESAKRYVSALLDHTFDLLIVHQFGVNHAEHIFWEIWKVLSTHESIRDWFVSLASKNIRSAGHNEVEGHSRPDWFVDGDLICFIAHVSRWQEFREIADKRRLELEKSRTVIGSRDISDSILEALEDDWEDQEFYRGLQMKTGREWIERGS